jgi:ribose transport system ATP-binding protein
MHDDPTAALEITGLTKRYGGTVALDDVSASFGRGRVDGLVGINGSGKSTLVKIVSGIEQPTSLRGLSFYGHRHVGAVSVAESHARGVRVLHQRPAQFLELSVTENLLLPELGNGGLGTFRWRTAHQLVREMLGAVELDIDPRRRFSRYSPAQRTMALIAKLLYGGGDSGPRHRILILDEPTAALPEPEAIWLLDNLKAQKATGHAIIYISHRLDELFYVTDALTVLRNGRVIAATATAETNEQDLVTLLLGHELEAADPVPVGDRQAAGHGTARLEVRGLVGGDAQGVDLTVQPGEIVGLTGIIGSGFLDTAELIFGARRSSAGEIRLDGVPFCPRHPSDAMRAGVAMVPSERNEMAVFGPWSVADNLTATNACVPAGRAPDTNTVIDTYGVKAPRASAPMWTLSGGNQQKVVLARWMERKPRLLILCEPTAGVDPGARDDLHRMIRSAAEKDCAVLVASSDADELESLAHRTLVVNRGRVDAEIEGGPGAKTRIRERII